MLLLYNTLLPRVLANYPRQERDKSVTSAPVLPAMDNDRGG